MKKVFIFAIAVGGLAFTACKKDHVCRCEITTTGTISASFSADTTFADSKKKDAEAKCTDLNESATIGAESITTVCALN